MPMAQAVSLPAVTLDVERKGTTIIVHCKGRLVAGVCDNFYHRVHELIPEGPRIILDLTDLKHLDSMGLGTLVRLYVSAKNAGSRLELVNLGKQIRELLGITNLLSVFGNMCEHGITPRF
jgi:anti-sigma B factor antagonist